MGKVLAGAGGFCGACGTAAAAAREAAGTGPCGSGEASAAWAEVGGGVRGSESRVLRGCGSSALGLRAQAPPPGSPARGPLWLLGAGLPPSLPPTLTPLKPRGFFASQFHENPMSLPSDPLPERERLSGVLLPRPSLESLPASLASLPSLPCRSVLCSHL